MLVKAKKLGFYGGQRRRAGDTFEIESKQHLGSWMVVIPVKRKPGPKAKPKPERVAVPEPELVEAEKEE